MGTYFVDIPNWQNLDSDWKNVEIFSTKEEALKYVQEAFGADEDGKISLIKFQEDETGEWKETAKKAIHEMLEGALVDEGKAIAVLDGSDCTHLSDIQDTLFFTLEHLYDELDPKEPFQEEEIDEWIDESLKSFAGKFKVIPSGITVQGERDDRARKSD